MNPRSAIYRAVNPALAAIALLFAICVPAYCGSAADPQTRIDRTQWRGREALRLSNGVAEAILVPSINRVIGFGYIGEPNLLWVNGGDLHKFGPWANWGGSRTWLAPLRQWPLIGTTGYPDPAWGDQPAVMLSASHGHVVLQGPRSRYSGVRIKYDYSFDSAGKFVTAETADKLGGNPIEFSIWNIVAICPPDSMQLPVRPDSPYKESYYKLYADPTTWIRHATPEVITISHSPTMVYYIGSDVPKMKVSSDFGNIRLTISGPDVNGEYPDGALYHGFPIEIYNADIEQGNYNELEFFSPLQVMKSGSQASFTLLWSLDKLSSISK